MSRRQWIKQLTALGIATRLSLLNAAWAAGKKFAAPGIQKTQGEVRINGQTARVGMQVKAGDSISTGPASEVIYVIGQDAYLQREDSVVTLAADVLKDGLRIISGKLLSVFGKGNKRLETATATIGIRGTGCYIESSPEKVYFCLCYGTAEVVPIAAPDQRETITTRYHDHPIYLHASGEQMMVPASVINHTDAELILLESLVGRLPPFYNSGYSPRY